MFNDGYGMRVGNCCRPGNIVVNDSLFMQNTWDGIEVESCFRVVPVNNVTNFTLANNTFDGNYGHGVRVNPMINMVGIMTNNTFKNHPRHTFLIDNTDDFIKEVVFREMKVDYAVIEKCNAAGIPLKVVPLDAGWNDLGSWDSLWSIEDKNEKGNVVHGDVVIEDTKDSLIHSTHRLVGAVGVENIIPSP